MTVWSYRLVLLEILGNKPFTDASILIHIPALERLSQLIFHYSVPPVLRRLVLASLKVTLSRGLFSASWNSHLKQLLCTLGGSWYLMWRLLPVIKYCIAFYGCPEGQKVSSVNWKGNVTLQLTRKLQCSFFRSKMGNWLCKYQTPHTDWNTVTHTFLSLWRLNSF